mmetsp:Transcript_3515/g.14050  ORF Transcript_3515/g.14050 Transcript_3515/m.14050 type:complete len:241 (+) Transcript_3515:844-1566(+)
MRVSRVASRGRVSSAAQGGVRRGGDRDGADGAVQGGVSRRVLRGERLEPDAAGCRAVIAVSRRPQGRGFGSRRHLGADGRRHHRVQERTRGQDRGALRGQAGHAAGIHAHEQQRRHRLRRQGPVAVQVTHGRGGYRFFRRAEIAHQRLRNLRLRGIRVPAKRHRPSGRFDKWAGRGRARGPDPPGQGAAQRQGVGDSSEGDSAEAVVRGEDSGGRRSEGARAREYQRVQEGRACELLRHG